MRAAALTRRKHPNLNGLRYHPGRGTGPIVPDWQDDGGQAV
jgi:hypothetical protein